MAGREELRGDEVLAGRLAAAFRVPSRDEGLPVEGVHGIHPYPARLHPAWVRGILEMVPPDALILDPFCGSGTTLVEASRSGRRSAGSDLNVVGLRIARMRTTRRDQSFLEAYASAAGRVHEDSSRRRETPFGALAKGEKRYPPHVLTQLINLRAAIERESDPALHEALLLTMSPLLTKFAARKGRNAPNVNRRAVRDHFLRRAELTVDAWVDFAEVVAPGLPDPELELSDARKVPWKSHSVDVVISSPPYPGVYDYVAEQQHRERWIGRDSEWLKKARSAEIGSRGGSGHSWIEGMHAVLRELTRVTRPGAMLFFVMGDGAVGAKALRADQMLRHLLHGRDVNLKRVAMVSQERPHFHGPSSRAFADRPRREHLILLERP
ncbi:MAG: DNA methyltransferase [Myxococcota bacterium]|nr:DNA methyltransferase [Myxococcota bacterium]